ncbi:MAG: PilT/PilU family type 4a pilus ATPase [Chthoniobacteraceae bacterium]|nr:PilT/PilU family type 4a pilus ATPase [Chthoniobacteraceae bacterium]
MKKPDLDAVLQCMIESHEGISDLLFAVGRPLQVEAQGALKPVRTPDNIFALTPTQVEHIALTIIHDDRRLLDDLLESGSCDCGYGINDRTRFRVNIFRQRGNWAIVMRRLQAETPSIQNLNLPHIFLEMVEEKNGLILVTGATGSGKTTTLASILNEINRTKPVHIVTLEDPIEFVHRHQKATFNQRELGIDFDTYPNGLRAALRQAPKVILVGEMRDRETVEIALAAAETGHLVLSTLHTVDAGQSISRILGMFPREEEKQLRLRLSEMLRYIVSQRLAPRTDGQGRALLTEIMGHNLRTQEAIALGETDGRDFYDIITDSHTFGWMTFDQAITRAYEADIITEATATQFATRKGIVQRHIDQVKKQQGLSKDTHSGLRLDNGYQTGAQPAPAAPPKRGFFGL